MGGEGRIRCEDSVHNDTDCKRGESMMGRSWDSRIRREMGKGVD